MDLFLRRDCGVGFGPAVDAPRVAGFGASAALAGAGAWFPPCVAAAEVLESGAALNKEPGAEDVGAAELDIPRDVEVAVDVLGVDLFLSACPKAEKSEGAGLEEDAGGADGAVEEMLFPSVNGLAVAAAASEVAADG